MIPRLLWFIAGAVAGYIASGYVEGLMDDGDKEERDPLEQIKEVV